MATATLAAPALRRAAPRRVQLHLVPPLPTGRCPTRPGARPGARRGVRRAVRLTRRGRAVVVGLAVGLLLAAFSLGRVSTSAATHTSALRHVTVHPGETLWQFAERVAPQDDPRVTVLRIMRLNGLDGPEVRAGQSLLLPR